MICRKIDGNSRLTSKSASARATYCYVTYLVELFKCKHKNGISWGLPGSGHYFFAETLQQCSLIYREPVSYNSICMRIELQVPYISGPQKNTKFEQPTIVVIIITGTGSLKFVVFRSPTLSSALNITRYLQVATIYCLKGVVH